MEHLHFIQYVITIVFVVLNVKVLQNYIFELLKQGLENTNYITIMSDASNHNDIKFYLILVRYFSFETGVNIFFSEHI